MPTIEYTPLSLAELVEFELPPLEWVVENLLPRGSLTLFSAREKSGKTLLTYYLGACVARGDLFLDRAVAPGPVLLVPAEEHLREVRDRLLRLVGDDLDVSIHVLPVNRGENDLLDLDDPETVAALREVIEEIGPQVVVLDPMRELHQLAENDADAMGPLLRPLRQLAHETDTAIILVHHMSRNGQFRGSTAILAACDNEWALRSPDDGDDSTVLRGTLTVKGRAVPKQVIGIRLGEEGRWETTSPPPQTATTTKVEMYEFLAACEEPTTAAEIAEEIGAEVKTVQNCIAAERRAEAPRIVALGTGRRNDPYRYALAEAS